jgi:hypothetical protein
MRRRRRPRHPVLGSPWLWAAVAAAAVFLLGRRRGRAWIASLAGLVREAALTALSEVFDDAA